MLVKNTKNSTEIYIKNYGNQKFLLNKSAFIYLGNAVINVEMIKNDLFLIEYPCDKKEYLIYCRRFFNRQTNQLSDIYQDLLDYNAKKISSLTTFKIKFSGTFPPI